MRGETPETQEPESELPTEMFAAAANAGRMLGPEETESKQREEDEAIEA
ncbi:hypothetical protein [Sporisorium scitamineum]|uniref:Uncharacterized protein n=1 Tax=Sporisorium scitamineum TaxID=49012 RepID=A0A0F7S904_9BASI|nr:hypothetical protein [Sporisorium scitamineum]